MFKIVSWNVNGIRAVAKKAGWQDLISLNSDVYCLQEIKAQESQIDIDNINQHLGTKYYIINNTKSKAGYSGVATFSKEPLENPALGFGHDDWDLEGRIAISFIAGIKIYNIYFPNGRRSAERVDYKLAFTKHLAKLTAQDIKSGIPVIVLGDFNTAYAEIDLARPQANVNKSGFLSIERQSLDWFLKDYFVDSFRFLYPDVIEKYSWWDTITKSRERNVGWRIDAIYISKDLIPRLLDAGIADHVYGSDHAPVWIELKI